MRAIVTAVVAAIEGCAAAIAGLTVIAIPAVLLWVVTFNIAAEPEAVAAAAAGVWLLAHFVPMQFTLPQETMLTMGLGTEPLTFILSLAPLAITCISAIFAVRAGVRLSRRGGLGAAGLIGGAVGFAAVGFGAASVAAPFAAWPLWGAVTVPPLVYLGASAAAYTIAAATAGSQWWLATVRGMQRGLEYLGVHGGIAAFPARAAHVASLTVGTLAGIVGLAAVMLAVALAVGFADVIALAQALQLDTMGSLLLFLVELALLPTAVIWSLAWLSGPGFSVGGEFSPFSEASAALPSLPMFGALPSDWGILGAVAPLLLVLVAFAVGMLLSRNSDSRRASWATALTLPVIAAAATGLAVAGLCVLGSGSLGPGSMAALGPDPLLVGAWVAAECAAGLLIGVTMARLDYSRLTTAITLPEPIAKWSAERASLKAQEAADVSLQDAETVDLSQVRDDLVEADEQRTAPVIDLFESVLHEPLPESSPEPDPRVDDQVPVDEMHLDEVALDEMPRDETTPEGAHEDEAVFDIEVVESADDATMDLTAATESAVTGTTPSTTPSSSSAQELEDAEAIERAFAWDPTASSDSPGGQGAAAPSDGPAKLPGKFRLPGWRARRDRS